MATKVALWQKEDDVMAEKPMNASNITPGQMENLLQKIGAAMRKHFADLDAEAVQNVIETKDIGLELLKPFRRRVEKITKELVYDRSVKGPIKFHSFIESDEQGGGVIIIWRNKEGFYTHAIPNPKDPEINIFNFNDDKSILVYVKEPDEKWKKDNCDYFCGHKSSYRDFWFLKYPYYLWVIGERDGSPLAEIVKRAP